MIERNLENIPTRHLPASKNWGSEIEEISPDNLLSFFLPLIFPLNIKLDYLSQIPPSVLPQI